VFKSAPQPEPPADRFRDEFTAPSHPVTPTEADAVWSGPSPPRDSGASRRPTLGSRAFLAAASRTELTSPPPSDSLLPPTPLAKTMTEGMRRDETEERLAAARANYEQELARVTESEALARRQEVARVRAEFEAQLARQSEQIAEAHSRSVQLQEAVRRGETQQRVWEEKCRASEQQGQTLEQHLLQFRQMQAQRDQQFQNLRTQMLAAQEQRDSQIAILRTQLARLQDSGSAVAELSRLRSEMGELQSRLQDSDQALQAAQRDHQLQAQRWTRELQAAGNWVGKLTEAVAAKDKRIAELESQVTRVPAALTRAGGAESELQAQLMAAKVEVGSLKRSGEVAQLQVVKMESQLQESRAQTASALREVALARDRLEKLIVQEKSPKDAFSPQLGKRLSLNLTDTRLAGMPVEPEKKRDDSLG
jgi:chromosome segregation ATPase